MRKFLVLALFGLVAQMAAGQVSEINSPTGVNLNCVLVKADKAQPNNISIFIFGDGGLGYVSKDKCVSWQQLNIDPVQKRDINFVQQLNDTLIFVYGGKQNNLCKASYDGGKTFKDFLLPNKDPVHGIAASLKPYGQLDYVKLYQVKAICLWELPNPYITVASKSLYYPGEPCVYLSSYDNKIIREVNVEQVLGTNGYSWLYSTYSLRTNITWDFPMGMQSTYTFDSITSVATYNGMTLMSLYNGNNTTVSHPGDFSYDVIFKTPEEKALNAAHKFPEFGKTMTIKSSLITPPHMLCWHVGGDIYGKNGFIVKEGVIIKTIPDARLNGIYNCSVGSSDAYIAVGERGKIFSNRSDLKKVIIDDVKIVESNLFSVFPNPFRLDLNVNSDKDCYVNLVNAVGETVKSLHLAVGVNTFSLSNLKAGIYFLKNEHQTLKLIKQ